MFKIVKWALLSGGAALALLPSLKSAGPSRTGDRAAAVVAPGEELASMPVGTSGGEVVLRPDSRGHYEAELLIAGARVRAIVDTGASVIAIPQEVADRAGILVPFGAPKVRLGTANGTVTATMIRLREVRLGDIVVRDVDAVIQPRGALGVTLLGNSFLNRLKGWSRVNGNLRLQG